MKLSILIPSRGNPTGLITVIGALRELSSDKHELDFKVALDSDDNLLPEYKNLALAFNVKLFIEGRASSLGQLNNKLAANIEETDCYLPMSDRMICLTPGWDEMLSAALADKNDCIFWWNNPYGLVFPIIPVKWYKAAGQIFTEYFPFWFDDTWLSELNAMVHGLPHRVLPIQCHMKRATRTKRLRDLRFWMDFFIMKRPERFEHAKKIAENMGIKINPNNAINISDEFWKNNWQRIEDAYKDLNPPDEIYLTAKAKAEIIMNTAAKRA